MAIRSANIDESSNIAAKISGMDDDTIKAFLKNNYTGFIYSVIKSVMQKYNFSEYDMDSSFVEIMRRFPLKQIKQFKAESSFKIFITALVVEKTEEHLKRVFKIKDSHAGNNSISGMNFKMNGALDQEYLSIERRELFLAASDIVDDELANLKPAGKLLYRLRVYDKKSFKEINNLLKIDSSTRDFDKMIKAIRKAVAPRISNAVDNYFGG